MPADSSCKIMKKIPPERCINDNHFIQFKVTLHRASGHLPALVSFRAFSLAICFVRCRLLAHTVNGVGVRPVTRPYLSSQTLSLTGEECERSATGDAQAVVSDTVSAFQNVAAWSGASFPLSVAQASGGHSEC